MEAEKANLTGEKQALEMEKTGIKEELVRVEQEKMDLDTEKMGRCIMCATGTDRLPPFFGGCPFMLLISFLSVLNYRFVDTIDL